MDYITIIYNAAKAAKVSGILLLAICTHESSNFTLNFNPDDKGTPTYGICQVKEATARFMGYKGKTIDLLNPYVSAKWAAVYMNYQVTRYGSEDWCVLTSAYNAGSYKESLKAKGKPTNLKYVNLVKEQLSEPLKRKLECNVREEWASR